MRRITTPQVRAVSFLSLFLPILLLFAPASAAGPDFAAKASVQPNVQYLGDTVGTVFTFTIHNTGTTATIGAVEIDRPSNQWTIVGCPQAPAGWTASRSDTMCRYKSADGTADDIKPGQSSSTFQVKATTLGGTADRPGTWGVTVSKSNQFDNKSLLTAASAEPPGLGITVYSWEIMDAIVDGSPNTPGSACPAATAANHSAITGTSGHTIVICGKNHMTVAGTPQASRSTLGGTFIASAGTFSSGSIAANSASSVVLGKWSNVTITNVSGAGKTIIAKIGSASNQNSPSTTLTGYEAKNQPPAAQALVVTTNEDTTSGTITLSATDPDGDAMAFAIVTSPSHGTLSALTPQTCTSSAPTPKTCTATLTYTPGANYNGPDSFTYKATDSFGAASAAATVNITVNPVNDAPVAVNDSYSTNEDTPKTMLAPGVLSNDSDVDSPSLSAVKVSDPSHGTLALIPDGSFTYTPDANYNGADSFTYKASDGSLFSNVVTVSITVNPVNDAPVAVNDSYTIDEDTSIDHTSTGGVLGNDTDVEQSPLTAALVAGPSHAAQFTFYPNGSFDYTPVANYNGSDSFTYKANDGSLDSNVATASITIKPVNDSPAAFDDNYTTDEDTPLTISAAGVLANDTDVDGDVLTAVLVDHPQNGHVALNADGSFTYTPRANFNGLDSFTYTANDGTVNSNVATVHVTVNPVNDPPVANNDSYPNSSGVLTQAAPGVMGNDTDPDSPSLTAVLVTGPTQASAFTLNSDGSFSYTANPGAGIDTFTYKANDGALDSNVATVTITNNQPPVAAPQIVTTSEDTPKAITLSATDADGDPMSFGNLTTPKHGSLGSLGTVNCDANTPQTCTVDVTYTPDLNYNGSDSFTFTADDGKTTSTPALVKITVNPVNDAPVAANDQYSTDEDTPLTVSVASGVLFNDNDVDGDTLTAVKVTDPAHGALTLNADGSFTYTPGANYNGSDSFTYKANDNALDSNVATVALTINPVNDAPVAAGQSVSTNEDTDKGITLSGSDVDGDSQGFQIVTGPAHGTLSTIATPSCTAGNCTADVTYTPDADYNGPDSFTFKTNDSLIDSNTATVNITVVPVNDPPTLANLENTPVSFTEGDAAKALTAAITVSDVDNTTLASASVSISAGYQSGADVLAATPPAGITPSFNAGTGVLSLTGSAPLADYQAALRSVTFANASENPGEAARTISFKVNDGTADSAVATRPLSVTAVNDPPVNTVPGSQTVNEDTELVFSTGNSNALSVADVDAGSGQVQVTVSAVNGTIIPATGSGATVTGSGTSSASMVGTLTQVNAALNGLKYKGSANWNSTRGTETLTILTNDQGNSGSQGGAMTDSDQLAITVNAVNDPPTAATATFSAQANMKIVGLQLPLSSATDPDTGDGSYTAVFSVASVGPTSPAGGTISNLNGSAGTFDFDPPPGVTGSVSVPYVVCDSGNPAPNACSAPTNVTVNVSGPVIWFVNPAAGVNGDGRLSSPFNSMTSADAQNTLGHRFFLYSGTASGLFSYAGNQWLIGQGVSGVSFDDVFGIAPPAGTITRPSVGGTRPVVNGSIILAPSGVLRGLNIIPPNGNKALQASGATGLIVNEVSATTTGIGAVDLSSSGGTLSFTSISANGSLGSSGIILTNTTGSFTVTGAGGTCTAADTSGCTGGEINNMGGTDGAFGGSGVYMTNAENVSLTRMYIHDHSNYGIRGTSVTGFTLDTSVVNGTNGTDTAASAGSPYNEGSIKIDNLGGSATFSNNAISGGISNNVRIDNTSATVNRVTFTGNTIGCNSTNNGEDGILLESENTGAVLATLMNNTFTCARGDLFNFVDNATSGTTDDLVFKNNALSNNHPAIATGGGGTTISSNGTKNFTFRMEANSFRDAVGHAVLLVKSTGSASYSGTFTGNTIGVAATANSGSLEGDGLKVQSAGQGSVTVAITNNQIRQYNNFGIELLTGGGAAAQSGTFDATVTGNTISNPGNNPNVAIPMNGIQLNGGTVPGDTYAICTQIGGAGALANTINGSGANGGTDVRLRQRQSTTVRLPGYGGGNTDDTAVQNFLIANNAVNPTALASHNVPPGGGFVGGAVCTAPSN